MDVQLDLSMCTARILEGWSLTDSQSEYKDILQALSTDFKTRVIDGHQWYQNNQYHFYEDRIILPEAVRLWALTTLFALSCLKIFKLKTKHEQYPPDP